ncbi:phage/plasmid primase, P4 family [uncultured Methanoculleus sp.]|uniref:DNA primase family protein n=1 Tax=uncultured Methanoculleus sp. TaxID=183762 RepID=UPI0032048CED
MTTDNLSPDEKIAIGLAGGDTLSTVAWWGGFYYNIPASCDLAKECGIPSADEATADERREQARRVLFRIAVYCHDKGLEAASNLSKRWSRLPEEVRPTPEEIEHLTKMAKVYQERARRDRNDEILSADQEDLTTGIGLTDIGNSERLIRMYGDDIRYCSTLKTWFVWDGRRWEQDETNRMLDLATRTAKAIFLEAATAPNSETVAKWAIKSGSLVARRAMIDGAVHMVPVRADEMDARENLFNCQNGTLDLETFEFREHRREDLLTKIAGVRYDPEATCPLWLDHLHTVFAGDEEVITGFQDMMGYSLLQYNPEQLMSILWGSGKNGKSETLKAIALILNDYAVNIESSTLMQSRHDDVGRARPDVLRLKGARFVTCTEPEQDAILSESLIKSLTGDHAVTARPLYGKPVEFVPGAKIFLATNHLPKIKGTDNGIWRRIWLFPFVAVIPPEKRQPEYGKVLFEQEGPGILNWMIEGLRRYRERGKLTQPAAVRRAMQDYRITSNPVGRFVTEACVVGPQERVGKSDLYGAYLSWCEAAGWRTLSQTKFGSFMKTLFDDYSDGNNRYWIGIRLKSEAELDNGCHTIEEQTKLSDHPTPGTDTTDTFAQTFSRIHAREKVTANVSGVSGEDVPPSVFATINTYTWHGGLERKGARCSVKGCGNQPEWVNKDGDWPLCSHHYNHLKRQAAGLAEVRL